MSDLFSSTLILRNHTGSDSKLTRTETYTLLFLHLKR